MIVNSSVKYFLLVVSLMLLAGCKPAAEQTSDIDIVAEKAAPIVEPIVEAASPPVAINDPAVINFQGFGPAKFGSNEESVRMSWGRPLNAGKPVEGSTCFYLSPETAPDQKRGIGFMFEEAKFVRYDINDADYIAPGDFKVGDAADTLLAAFAGRVEQAPHKYIEGGRTLTVMPEDKSASRLVFEVGNDGNITSWRIGVLPQVLYVEGCG